ncbi:MAG: hypothetical protein JRN15_16080, partial [Nitrososphaerota archaeon]|nr:hypothetical protein [Nitrososphaerota archaeon]
LGHLLPLPGRDFIGDYYTFTSVFLLIPTLLLVQNVVKIMEILKIGQKNWRVLVYLIGTPSFVFILLVNWYVIGLFFAVFGLRKFLEGGRNNSLWSGLLFGLSAASNLITAVPALGILIFGTNSWKERARFVSSIVVAVLVVYFPVIVLNSFAHSYLNASHATVHYPFAFPNTNFVSDFISYEEGWYAEGSWMLAFFSNSNPIRQYIFPIMFIVLSTLIVYKGLRMKKSATTHLDRADLVVTTCSLFTFAFLFSAYICTPQMNLLLLPFFALLPAMTKHYPEFLAFEIVNALVIVWGFSAPLAFLGINLPAPVQFGPIWVSPIQFLAVLRSFWIGKFLVVDGLLSPSLFRLRALSVSHS